MYVHPDRVAGQRETVKAWIRTGLHLPAFMRDFHAAKRLFKAVGNSPDMRGGDDPSLGAVGWSAAHVYVVDRFLWFMALHGYTLQRSRTKLAAPFLRLEDSLETHDQAAREAFDAMMAEARAERRLIGEEAPPL